MTTTIATPDQPESRRDRRHKLPPAYTLVRVRKAGAPRYAWTGHAYDVSISGLRFDIDDPLEPGTEVEVRATLPGRRHISFNATGRIVRIHDESGERGPVRMAVFFDKFASDEDESRLEQYLEDRQQDMAVEAA